MAAIGPNAGVANVLRCAVFVPPHVGGIFTFYRRLSQVLGPRVFSVEIEGEADQWRDYAPALAGPEHRRIALGGRTGQAAARLIAERLEEEGVDAILAMPLTPSPVIDALPHLPRRIRVLMRLTEISHHQYRLALRRPDTLDGIIVQCPRQADDLAMRAPGIPRHLIPNGVDTARFAPPEKPAGPGPLRLLVLDRLVHDQKRILLLPRLCGILDGLGVDFALTVAGTGPDEAALRRGLAPWIERGAADMIGQVRPDAVPALMARHGIYLKPSRNEGSPNGLLEAMAAGLVPIATRIAGVSDFVIQPGESGILVPIDAVDQMAAAVAQLGRDPEGLESMRRAARRRVAEEFSLSRMEERVHTAFTNIHATSRREPLPWSAWSSTEPRRSVIWQTAKRLVPLTWRVVLRTRLEDARRGWTSQTESRISDGPAPRHRHEEAVSSDQTTQTD